MPRHRIALAAVAGLLPLGGAFAVTQVFADPAPDQVVRPTDAPRERTNPLVTTTTTTTTTTAPAPPPPPTTVARKPIPRRSAPAPAPTPAPPPAPAPPAGAVAAEGAEAEVLSYMNNERGRQGVPALSMNGAARNVARGWSSWMANNHRLAHNSKHPQQLWDAGVHWTVVGENVGQGQSAAQVHGKFMGGSTHRNNILNPEFSQVGIGVMRASNGDLYITVDFVGFG